MVEYIRIMEKWFLILALVLIANLARGADASSCGPVFKKPTSTKPSSRAVEAKEKIETEEQKKEREILSRIARQQDTVKQYNLESFLSSNLEQNLAVLHPSTIITSAQKYYRLIHLIAPRRILEPNFRVKEVTMYPVFHGLHPATRGKGIVGHYEGIEEVANYIISRASGNREGKVPMLTGPAGTGKTEAVVIVDALRANESKNNPEFYEYSFEWIGLENIPATAPLLAQRNGVLVNEEVRDDMEMSPFVLLRTDIQERVLQLVSPEVQKKVGLPIQAWTYPAPKTQKIIKEIFKHYIPQIRNRQMTIEDLSAEEYLYFLSKHIRIYKKDYQVMSDDGDPAAIIRAMPENPNYSKLFTAEDIRRKLFYSDDNPLLYNYSGKVLKTNGGAMVLDEFPRNDPALGNTFLEVFQNSVVESDGPPVRLDTVVFLTSNDESIQKAKEDAAYLAMLSRMSLIPMRWNIHPEEIAATAIMSVGTHKFYMKKLPQPGDSKDIEDSFRLERAKLSDLYPEPIGGEPRRGINSRYALYVDWSGERILIAPHALELMSLLTASTRIVTDPQKMGPYWGELQVLSPQMSYYTDIKDRINVLLGKVDPGKAVREDLYKVSKLMKEGSMGIGARELKTWLERAIQIAASRPSKTLTPAVIDQAFKEAMAVDKFGPTIQARAEWWNRYQEIRFEFILPAIYKDVRTIVSGDGEKAARLYDTIVEEMVALSENQSAEVIHPDDHSSPKGINRTRLNRIMEIYKKMYGRDFSINFLLRHLVSAQGQVDRRRDHELLESIQAFLAETELNITDSADRIYSYYHGKLHDPNVQKEVLEVEGRLSRYGYNETAFKEAVEYWYRLRDDKMKFEKGH